MRFLVLLILCLCLSACGFHLRGYQAIPPQLKTLSIQTPDPYNDFAVQLRHQLTAMGATLVKDEKDAPVTLQVLNDNFVQQLTSISSNTQVRTYNLIYTVKYQLLNSAGKVIYGPQSVSTTSTYDTNDNQLLGDTDVLYIQKEQMVGELIFQMFNQINSTGGRKALASVK